MLFDLEWTLGEARYVTKDAYDAFVSDPDDEKLEENLRQRGNMFTHSIRVLNEFCKPEMANYRQSLVSHAPQEVQDELLSKLYGAYWSQMDREPFRKFFAFFGIK
jgi:hypothetical protein